MADTKTEDDDDDDNEQNTDKTVTTYNTFVRDKKRTKTNWVVVGSNSHKKKTPSKILFAKIQGTRPQECL